MTRARVKGLSVYLKLKRAEAGLTQMQAALALGHSTAQYVSNFERGLCEPSVESAAILCAEYGVPKKELYDVMVNLYAERLSDTLSLRKARAKKKA